MSGYGEPRTFETHPGAGGVESEYLGLPFVSTPSEDWYGFGDKRSPNRYNETGDLETDIKSLEKWIGLYRVGSGWHKANSNELYRKQEELNEIKTQKAWLQLSDEEQQRQQKLLQLNETIVTLESQIKKHEKILSGYGPQHYIRGSIIADINKLTEELEQKKTRN